MEDTYLFASHQHWFIRLILLFCRRHAEIRTGGMVYLYKTLRGRRYLIEAYHPTRRASRRFLLLHPRGK